jgi:hypothetical protein
VNQISLSEFVRLLRESVVLAFKGNTLNGFEQYCQNKQLVLNQTQANWVEMYVQFLDNNNFV